MLESFDNHENEQIILHRLVVGGHSGFHYCRNQQVGRHRRQQLSFARPNQTIELTAAQLASLGEKDLAKIHVRDAAGDEFICQAVDTDYDAYHQPDIVIFQADFAPNETKTFTVAAGAKQE